MLSTQNHEILIQRRANKKYQLQQSATYAYLFKSTNSSMWKKGETYETQKFVRF